MRRELRISRIAIGAMAVCVAIQAQAALYNFTYTDGVNAAHGNLATTMISGVEVATSGGMTVTAGSAAGMFFLLSNPMAPAQNTSPTQKFYYDNVVMPNSTPMLTLWGLLFSDGAREVNIYHDASGPGYSFWGWGFVKDSNGNDTYNPTGRDGTFTLEAVPEPFTMALGAAGLGLALARKRRSK